MRRLKPSVETLHISINDFIMKITQVEFTPALAAFFFDDQKAIGNNPGRNGFLYNGKAETPGFEQIRIPAKTISIILFLENGETAIGDCCAVQYSGTAGRDPLFKVDEQVKWLRSNLAPLLIGFDIISFKQSAEYFDHILIDDLPLHSAVRYGLSQALLDATARTSQKTMAEVILSEYGFENTGKPVRVFSQSGDDRYHNIEKMILKFVDVLPHGLINDPIEKVGNNGKLFRNFVCWTRERILELRTSNQYEPELHYDTYGTLGMVFDMDLDKIADFLKKLEKDASPFKLRIEHPIDGGSRENQILLMRKLRKKIQAISSNVELVADEWCNTLEDIKIFAETGAADMIQIKMPDLGGINNSIEALSLCNEYDIKAYLGGSCTETDISARVSSHLAVALQPHQVLAKPGMGVDEGLMIVQNEMKRTLQIMKAKMKQ